MAWIRFRIYLVDPGVQTVLKGALELEALLRSCAGGGGGRLRSGLVGIGTEIVRVALVADEGSGEEANVREEGAGEERATDETPREEGERGGGRRHGRASPRSSFYLG